VHRVCGDQNSAMGLAGGVLCRLSMTDACFGVLLQKWCMVACYGPRPRGTRLVDEWYWQNKLVVDDEIVAPLRCSLYISHRY
jgi:hypothetical protein